MQQFVFKSLAILGARNWNHCHRAYTIAWLRAPCECVEIGFARISTTVAIWFRLALNQMKNARCANVRMTALCLQERFLKSQACSHRLLGLPPTGHNISANPRGSQIYVVRYINAAAGLHVLYLGRCSSGQSKHPLGSSASRVQPSLCLRT